MRPISPDEDSARKLVYRTQRSVQQRMGDLQAGHGMDHVLRVTAMARVLQAESGGDLLTIELAALLHDVGDAKFHAGVERSAEFAREILSQQGADESLIDHIADIVDKISFRKSVDPASLTLEGKIVQDADRLDALGAIGIVRTIEYGASVGQPFHVRGSSNAKTGMGHFDEKLFKLKSLLNTDAARKIAEQREAFMRQFVQQYLSEVEFGGSTSEVC